MLYHGYCLSLQAAHFPPASECLCLATVWLYHVLHLAQTPEPGGQVSRGLRPSLLAPSPEPVNHPRPNLHCYHGLEVKWSPGPQCVEGSWILELTAASRLGHGVWTGEVSLRAWLEGCTALLDPRFPSLLPVHHAMSSSPLPDLPCCWPCEHEDFQTVNQNESQLSTVGVSYLTSAVGEVTEAAMKW